MTYRTILVDLSGDHSMAPRLNLAKALAQRFRATVIGMHVMMPPPCLPAALRGEADVIERELVEAHWAINRSVKVRMQELFQDVLGPEPHVLWRDALGDRGRLLALAARTADLVLIGNGDPGTIDTPGVVEQSIMAAGVPVLMLPAGATPTPGQVAFVGWNGSREATRAVHGALPFLVGAKRVILCAVGDTRHTLEDARLMLQRHEIAVEPRHIDAPDADAGEIMLREADGYGADLLVMGAYGHTRLRELIFGGATRHVLHGAAIPVLFCG